MNTVLFAGVFLFLAATSAFGENPIISDIFTSDPAALVYNDRVYLYTGHDEQRIGADYQQYDHRC